MFATTNELQASNTTLAHKYLINEKTWDNLIQYIVEHDDVDQSLAERIMNEALGFLRLISLNPGRTFCPSETVDIGWHAFLMHTREYTEFCERINGRFIHHAPTPVETIVAMTGGGAETVRSMKAAGLAVDDMLWVASADCGSEGACTSSGTCGGDGGC